MDNSQGTPQGAPEPAPNTLERQPSPAQAAYFNACNILGNIIAREIKAIGRFGQFPAIEQQTMQTSGQLMVREIEITALVQLLASKGLITEDEFFSNFVRVAGVVAKALQQAQQATPRILVAEANIPPRGRV